MLDMPQPLTVSNGKTSLRRAPPRRKPPKPAADRPPALVGWLSSDAEEVERRLSGE